ncbi:MAG TPA: BTAD domain-containing putative transcriptional regulator [Longimicrobiales bacterium]|nr:BTAD domain-containing putative transcriptional regulator [Longimicrobiales bacterium]
MKLLGSTELVREDGVAVRSVLAQPKRLALLVYLALHRPRGFIRREHLMALFWPEKDDAHARNALRQALHFLRRSLGKNAFASRGDGEIALVADRFQVDVWTLDEATDPREIRDLWRGPLLEGFHLDGCPELDHWLDAERARVRLAAWTTVLRCAEAAMREGRTEQATPQARFAVQLRPLDEAGCRVLMELLASQGHRAAAIREYERLEAALVEAIGEGPDEETRALARSIRDVGARALPGGSGASSLQTAHRSGPAPTTPAHPVRPTARYLAVLGLLFMLPLILSTGRHEPGVDRDSPEATPGGSHLPPVWLLVDASADTLARGVREALLELLRIDVNDDADLAFLPQDHVSDALQRMRRSTDEGLSRTAALELARRDGLAGVVRISVRQTGDGYLLTAEMLDRDGRPRGQHRETAGGRSELIPAFERMSRGLRARLGQVRITPSSPLPRVTTSSMEALEHYSLARAGGPDTHLERATALDPDFAMAWLELGERKVLWPRSGPGARSDLQRAWELRNAVSRAERHRIEFAWYHQVEGDAAAAAAASDAYIGTQPDESTWLAQQVLLAWRAGRWSEAVELSRRWWTVDGELSPRAWQALVGFQVLLDDEEGLARTLSEPPTPAEGILAEFRIASGLEEWDDALRLLREGASVLDRPFQVWPLVPLWETRLNQGAGRLRLARDRLRVTRDTYLSLGQGAHLVHVLAQFALGELWLAQDTAAALSLLDQAEAQVEELRTRPVLDLAWALAEAGEVERSRGWIERWEEATGDVPRVRRPRMWWVALAAIALAEGRPSDAAVLLQEPIHEPVGQTEECRFCPELMMARALERSGRTQEAVGYYESFLSSRYIIGVDRELGGVLRTPARERLAALYEGRGRPRLAAEQYRRILELWVDADPELDRRLDAARAGLARSGG